MDKSGFENNDSGESHHIEAHGIGCQQNERLFVLARRIATELAGCTPQRRAFILRQAQTLWDDRAHSPAGVTEAGAECMRSDRAMAGPAKAESFLEVTSEWLAAVLNELPPLTRIEILQLLSQLKENARFDRLAMGVQLETGE